ncbi:hypothetical protein ACHAXS_013185 [Conticribra weissflogii]
MTPSLSQKRRRRRGNEKCMSLFVHLPLALASFASGLQTALPPAIPASHRRYHYHDVIRQEGSEKPASLSPLPLPLPLRLRQRQRHHKPRGWNDKQSRHFSFSSTSSANGDDHELPSHESADEPPAPTIVGAMPTTRQMLLFLSTTVLVWVSEPLLSLVDSAAVGTYAGTGTASVVQLAALGPATMLCDSSVFVTYFLGLAATNLVARASAKRDWRAQIQTSSHVLGVSVALGLAITTALLLFGEPWLRRIIGPAGALIADAATGEIVDATEQVVRIAVGYARIRTAAAVFAIAGSTAQSLLLCALDTRTVATATAVATALNIAGDAALVAWKGWGVWGAGVATSAASIAANSLLIWKGRKLVDEWRGALWEERWGGEKPVPARVASSVETLETSGKDERERREREREEYLVAPFVSLPDRKAFLSLIYVAGPIFLVMVGKLIEFWSMTVKAGNFGMVAMACHNVLMRLFFFFGTFGDGLAQAAQTFLPGLFVKKKKKEIEAIANTNAPPMEKDPSPLDATTTKRGKKARRKVTDIKLPSSRSRKVRKLIQKLATISIVIGGGISISARYLANNAGAAFTSDAQLVSLMANVSNYMGLVLLLHPLKEMLEGTMIASRDLKFLLWCYGLTAALFLAKLSWACTEFVDIWRTAFLFQLVRIVLFGSRAWWRTKKRGVVPVPASS